MAAEAERRGQRCVVRQLSWGDADQVEVDRVVGVVEVADRRDDALANGQHGSEGLHGTAGLWSPSACLKALASATSPSGVDVAWALMDPISAALRFASRRASRMLRP